MVREHARIPRPPLGDSIMCVCVEHARAPALTRDRRAVGARSSIAAACYASTRRTRAREAAQGTIFA